MASGMAASEGSEVVVISNIDLGHSNRCTTALTCGERRPAELVNNGNIRQKFWEERRQPLRIGRSWLAVTWMYVGMARVTTTGQRAAIRESCWLATAHAVTSAEERMSWVSRRGWVLSAERRAEGLGVAMGKENLVTSDNASNGGWHYVKSIQPPEELARQTEGLASGQPIGEGSA
ncbi:hypothetical protein BDP27DRAFT_1407251 [Rhodocollybia butyracea]|uniref:Uncharacterized protein n=1 Tax=Rhodocollybia butyracea TaxID=206335 RepID=A0A9P5P8E3_9AGAR|nr:hypothetical protein BDP27DRAFT_1407251 [Rhodocollybia butyracea]